MVVAPTLLRRLAATPAVHRLTRALRLQPLVAQVLRRAPLVRRADGDIRYRLRTLESFLIADEIFGHRVYAAAFEGCTVRTFVDVGTNVGYFPCFAASVTRSRELVGLALDANPAVIEEAEWHVRENGLSNVKVLHGLVGCAPEVKQADFFVAGSNVSASAQPRFNPAYPLKGDVKQTTVPTVDVLSAWRAHAGDARIDVLKLDIEGFEEVAIDNLTEVLALTERVAIEWHNWMTSRSRIESKLGALGFTLTTLVSEDADAGIGIFSRS